MPSARTSPDEPSSNQLDQREFTPPINAAMEAVTLKITFSGSTFEVRTLTNSTWDEVIAKLSTQVRVDADGLRLLYRGHTVERGSTLVTSRVKDGSRLMALKTGKQHNSELKARERVNAVKVAMEADLVREQAIAEGGSSESASHERPSKNRYLGDAVDGSPDVLYVLVCQGSKTYAVLVKDESLTVHDLKLRLEGMTGVMAKDLRLLFGGKSDIDDGKRLLGDLHVKRGSKFILLFKRAQHDRLDTQEELAALRAQTEALLEGVVRAERKVKSRLISDYAELSLLVGELGGECSRLLGNIKAVHVGKDEASNAADVVSLSETLQGVELRVSTLQEASLSMLRR